MAFKPNYNQQRSDRTRTKEQKKQEKLQRREEEAARKRAERGEAPTDSDEPTATVPEDRKDG